MTYYISLERGVNSIVIAIIILSLALLVQCVYMLAYRRQVKDMASQLSFILEHRSFKLVHMQLRPRELYGLVEQCNRLLLEQRRLNEHFLMRNEEINTTIVSLSHDIRTPLTSLDGYLQLAESAGDLTEATHYIELARSRIEQIVTLVDQLFFYTKLQNPEYELELEPIDIVEIIQKGLLGYEEHISKSGDMPHIHLPDHPVHVSGQLNALERVIDNIVNNYLRHGDGSLLLDYELDENKVTFRFVNKLKPGHVVQADNIFSRFYKGDVARTVNSTGLGLAIVDSIMKKINGRAAVSADTEQFRISITLARIERGSDDERR